MQRDKTAGGGQRAAHRRLGPIDDEAVDGAVLERTLAGDAALAAAPDGFLDRDRKSTRLNSSHLGISYAVFCLKKKKQTKLAFVLVHRRCAGERFARLEAAG